MVQNTQDFAHKILKAIENWEKSYVDRSFEVNEKKYSAGYFAKSLEEAFQEEFNYEPIWYLAWLATYRWDNLKAWLKFVIENPEFELYKEKESQ